VLAITELECHTYKTTHCLVRSFSPRVILSYTIVNLHTLAILSISKIFDIRVSFALT
jgi:hypothetical protein